jgi:hypothetical protein
MKIETFTITFSIHKISIFFSLAKSFYFFLIKKFSDFMVVKTFALTIHFWNTHAKVHPLTIDPAFLCQVIFLSEIPRM